MNPMKSLYLVAFLPLCLIGSADDASAQQSGASGMTFFITSAGSGKGADLGGLAGRRSAVPDARIRRRCRQSHLARLSQHQRRRRAARRQCPRPRRPRSMGERQGHPVARDLDELHRDPNINKETGLTEKGETVKGRGDQPNTHDILTGSQPDGTAFAGADDMTCGNWTRSGTEGAAMVGHHDRMGLDDKPPAKSWNSSHPSRGGCSQDALRGTGGAGFLYCFAAN